MGPIRFLVFYLLCGLAAGFAHTVFNAGSMIPAVGASGAIAGVLAAYLLMYPLSKVVCIIPIFIIPFFVDVPAFIFGIFWFVLQILSGTADRAQGQDAAGIAWWAHIGGFVAGLLLCKVFARNPAPVLRTPAPITYRPRRTYDRRDWDL
jgi:membrane associated rhomboid family serine protease